jgi:hypothetical protein
VQNLTNKIIPSIVIFLSLGMIVGYDEVIKLGEIHANESSIVYLVFKTSYMALFTLLGGFLFHRTFMLQGNALRTNAKSNIAPPPMFVWDAITLRGEIAEEFEEIQVRIRQGRSIAEHREWLLELRRRILELQPILGDRDEHPPWANNHLETIAQLLGDEASPVITH